MAGSNIVAVEKSEIRVQRPPTHPGAVLSDVLEDTNLSISNFARGIHLSRQTVYKILSGKASVSPEVAVKIGRFLGNGPEVWLGLQVKYDLWIAEKLVVDAIIPYQACG